MAFPGFRLSRQTTAVQILRRTVARRCCGYDLLKRRRVGASGRRRVVSDRWKVYETGVRIPFSPPKSNKINTLVADAGQKPRLSIGAEARTATGAIRRYSGGSKRRRTRPAPVTQCRGTGVMVCQLARNQSSTRTASCESQLRRRIRL